MTTQRRPELLQNLPVSARVRIMSPPRAATLTKRPLTRSAELPYTGKTVSPCIEWIFGDSDGGFAGRVHAAKAAGFDAVEFHLWRDKPMAEVAEALHENGMRLTSFCVDPRRSLIDRSQHDDLVEAVRESIEAGKAVGSPPMIIASGFTVPGLSHEQQHQNAIEGLLRVAEVAEEAGVMLLLEPLNNRIELPGMYLSSTSQALDLIEAVDSPNLRLLYDMYHSAVMDEAVPGVLEGRVHLVYHVQVADTDGRHEPGTGGIGWTEAMKALTDLGYTGDIGLEYLPTLPSAESVKIAMERIGR